MERNVASSWVQQPMAQAAARVALHSVVYAPFRYYFLENFMSYSMLLDMYYYSMIGVSRNARSHPNSLGFEREQCPSCVQNASLVPCLPQHRFPILMDGSNKSRAEPILRVEDCQQPSDRFSGATTQATDISIGCLRMCV